MSQLIRLVLLLAAASLLSVSTCLAADISKGLNCPPGWTDNKSARDNGLIKQCLSPSEKAFINLYLVSEEKTALSEILDRWTAKMKKEGMPLQNMLSESPAHVSGYPAISRSYSGTSQDGAHLKSRLTVSRYHGKNYILQGVYPEGNQRSQELVSHALNIWHYPEASQPPKKHANAKKTSAADAHPGKYKNIGCCWAWGLWKTASGEMVAILPDGRAVFNGNKEKRWRRTDSGKAIIVELPFNWGGGTAVWSHPEGRNDAIILPYNPKAKPLLIRESWEYEYNGMKFKACTH